MRPDAARSFLPSEEYLKYFWGALIQPIFFRSFTAIVCPFQYHLFRFHMFCPFLIKSTVHIWIFYFLHPGWRIYKNLKIIRFRYLGQSLHPYLNNAWSRCVWPLQKRNYLLEAYCRGSFGKSYSIVFHLETNQRCPGHAILLGHILQTDGLEPGLRQTDLLGFLKLSIYVYILVYTGKLMGFPRCYTPYPLVIQGRELEITILQGIYKWAMTGLGPSWLEEPHSFRPRKQVFKYHHESSRIIPKVENLQPTSNIIYNSFNPWKKTPIMNRTYTDLWIPLANGIPSPPSSSLQSTADASAPWSLELSNQPRFGAMSLRKERLDIYIYILRIL